MGGSKTLGRARGVAGLAEEDGKGGTGANERGATSERPGRTRESTALGLENEKPSPGAPITSLISLPRPFRSCFSPPSSPPPPSSTPPPPPPATPMGRLNSPLVQRASPAPARPHKPSRFGEHPAIMPSVRIACAPTSRLTRRTAATRLAQHQKSPYIAAARAAGVARSPGPRARLHSTNTNRFLSSRTQLSTIQEEPEEDDTAHATDDPRELYRHFDTWPHPHEDTRPGPSRRQEQDDDVDMLGWDEETTLVAMLQERFVAFRAHICTCPWTER